MPKFQQAVKIWQAGRAEVWLVGDMLNGAETCSSLALAWFAHYVGVTKVADRCLTNNCHGGSLSGIHDLHILLAPGPVHDLHILLAPGPVHDLHILLAPGPVHDLHILLCSSWASSRLAYFATGPGPVSLNLYLSLSSLKPVGTYTSSKLMSNLAAPPHC